MHDDIAAAGEAVHQLPGFGDEGHSSPIIGDGGIVAAAADLRTPAAYGLAVTSVTGEPTRLRAVDVRDRTRGNFRPFKEYFPG